ncbi:hypothetical protein LCI18_013802 [Fusarium solani-melongenae]|uniref:Uncharacterized protein n=1 Tax=Fusarium solani subsp. cucurbitae TaxID=2747967 RepID=A0ACD3ZPI8_FUSSC|nr:hypothetical protein LCI18_013802 [Fusarium solani-melongenae]
MTLSEFQVLKLHEAKGILLEARHTYTANLLSVIVLNNHQKVSLPFIKMKIESSLLTALLTGSLVSAKYTVEIPKDAIWVTNWDQLHEMAAKYPDTALVEKYGGNVIEVDGKIVLATDQEMNEQIDDLIEQLEKNNPEGETEPKTPNRRDLPGHNRPCSHPGCFYSSTCLTYTNCHVCRRPTSRRGFCI